MQGQGTKGSAKPGRQERREGSIEFVRLFDVRDVTGFGDFDQLAVGKILERFAAEIFAGCLAGLNREPLSRIVAAV